RSEAGFGFLPPARYRPDRAQRGERSGLGPRTGGCARSPHPDRGSHDRAVSLETALAKAIGGKVGIVADPVSKRGGSAREFADLCRRRGITVYEAQGAAIHLALNECRPCPPLSAPAT